MTTRPTPRRAHTRWLLVVPLLGLAVVVAGVVALEAHAPQAAPVDLTVDGVPALAFEDERSCIRRRDETEHEDIREDFQPGGRVSSTQVYLCPAAFDGLDVTYVGEVVGEVLPRRGGAWAQVNDDPYALQVGPVIGHRELAGFNTGMSVWLPGELRHRIADVGRPGKRGDVILVRGSLHQSDPDDGGGITIRAREVDVLAESVEIDKPIHVVQIVVAAVLAALAIASVVWAARVRRL